MKLKKSSALLEFKCLVLSLLRYCEERFISKYIATIGVDYGVKPVQIMGRQIRVNFWDLSGHEAFFEIRNEFYKDAQGILLVFDVTSRDSFDGLGDWLAEATKFGANMKNIPIVLCANKVRCRCCQLKTNPLLRLTALLTLAVWCVLQVDKRREVGEDEGREFASSRGFLYYETSACTGANVTEVFDNLFQRVVQNS